MNIAKNRLLSQEVAICLADGQPQACLQPCQIISFTHSFNNFIMGLKKTKQTLFQSSDYRLLQNAQWVEWGVYSEIWRANQLSRFWSLQPEKCTKCTKGFVSETDGKKVLLRMCVISHRGDPPSPACVRLKKKKTRSVTYFMKKTTTPPTPKMENQCWGHLLVSGWNGSEQLCPSESFWSLSLVTAHCNTWFKQPWHDTGNDWWVAWATRQMHFCVARTAKVTPLDHTDSSGYRALNHNMAVKWGI